MVVLQFSDKAARTLEAIYASADVVAQRRATLDRLALAPSESVVDIGCGPGFLCEEMADAVGESGRVVGVDVSDDLLTFARGRNTRQWLAYEQRDARQLALPDASFDAAVSVQTLEYIDAADRAIGEMFRVLKPGGRALVVNTDWDRVAWYSSDQDRMARVRQAWEAHCAHPRLPQTLVPRLRAAGFTISSVGTFPIINTRLVPNTYSHGLVDLILDFLEDRETVDRQELAAWAAELHTLSDEDVTFSAPPGVSSVQESLSDTMPNLSRPSMLLGHVETI